jgi:hypothetical protein
MKVLKNKGAFSSNRSSGCGSVRPGTVHTLGFPKYDGAEDPLGWLHKAEQLFHSQVHQRINRSGHFNVRLQVHFC